jgi:hypothetical protein
VGIFRPGKIANKIGTYPGYPFTTWFVPADTLETTCVGAIFFCVPYIFGMRGITEIGPAIIAAISVYVIDLGCRPRSSHIKNREAVSQVFMSFHFDSKIAVVCLVASERSNFCNSSSGADFPSKLTRAPIVT